MLVFFGGLKLKVLVVKFGLCFQLLKLIMVCWLIVLVIFILVRFWVLKFSVVYWKLVLVLCFGDSDSYCRLLCCVVFLLMLYCCFSSVGLISVVSGLFCFFLFCLCMVVCFRFGLYIQIFLLLVMISCLCGCMYFQWNRCGVDRVMWLLVDFFILLWLLNICWLNWLFKFFRLLVKVFRLLWVLVQVLLVVVQVMVRVVVVRKWWKWKFMWKFCGCGCQERWLLVCLGKDEWVIRVILCCFECLLVIQLLDVGSLLYSIWLWKLCCIL